MTLVQARLKSGATNMTCWIESGRAKIGDRVTLKNFREPDLLWDILELGVTTSLDKINRGWNNNI